MTTNDQPTPEQLEALCLFAKANGRTWKSRLRWIWECGDYYYYPLGGADGALLQQVRNGFGPSWLVRFSLRSVRFGEASTSSAPTVGDATATEVKAEVARLYATSA